MRAKRIWSVQSLLTCFFWNAVLVGLLYFMADRTVDGLRQWVDPFLKPGGTALPEDARSAFASLDQFLTQIRTYVALVVLGVGGVATFILWMFVMAQGRSLVARVEAAAQSVLPSPAPQTDKPEPKTDRPAPAAPSPTAEPSPQPVIQLLSSLQSKGRFIDFLQEDLSPYGDAQIGAVARSVHQGCNRALAEYVEMKSIFDESEGTEVAVPPNFDVNSVRLTGNVSGNPPFHGILRHRGWKAVKVRLPKAAAGRDKEPVLAPAEVEIGATAP